MFSGFESIRIQTNLPEEEVREIVEESLSRLGRARISDRGSDIDIVGSRFSNFATDAKFQGEFLTSRKQGEYEIRLIYHSMPSALCWVTAIAGFFLCLFGPLILLWPLMAKSKLAEEANRALSEVDREFRGERRESKKKSRGRRDDDEGHH